MRRHAVSLRSLTIVAAIMVAFPTILAEPASSATARAYQKLPGSGVVLKKKSGYYIQCYYSGLGETCEYVYARVRTSNGNGRSRGMKLRQSAGLLTLTGWPAAAGAT